MSFHDPISDLLTRIRNAMGAQHRYVDVDKNRMKVEIVQILKNKGYIDHYLTSDEKQKIRIFLKYTKSRKPIIQGLKRISSPGLRKYVGYREIPPVMSGLGIAILSTPKGVLDDASARHHRVGGEILCKVW